MKKQKKVALFPPSNFFFREKVLVYSLPPGRLMPRMPCI